MPGPIARQVCSLSILPPFITFISESSKRGKQYPIDSQSFKRENIFVFVSFFNSSLSKTRLRFVIVIELLVFGPATDITISEDFESLTIFPIISCRCSFESIFCFEILSMDFSSLLPKPILKLVPPRSSKRIFSDKICSKINC